MTRFLSAAALVLGLMPLAVTAELGARDLPPAVAWYLHVDLDLMRESDGGRPIYEFLENEVFAEIRTEAGVDVGQELDRVTAFATEKSGVVMVLEGPVSQATQDKLLAIAAADTSLRQFESGGRTYFLAEDTEARLRAENVSVDIEAFEDRAYFSFALDDKVIVTSTAGEMEALLGSNGRIAGSGSHSGSMFVLSAERSLLQAGFDTDQLSRSGDDFQSNLINNTRHIAVLVAEAAGKLAVEAQLTTDEPSMASSLASVARGLLGLMALDTDADPEVLAMLRNTRIDVDGNALQLKLAVDPRALIAAIDD